MRWLRMWWRAPIPISSAGMIRNRRLILRAMLRSSEARARGFLHPAINPDNDIAAIQRALAGRRGRRSW